MSNSTCFPKKASQEGPPLFQNGHIVIQTHDIGWLITGVFTIIATVTSLWLVNKHLQWYTNKHEQRYIVRLLFMVPIYSLISLASYLFWDHSTPLLLIRDGYESTVLTAFFYLLLTYLSPSSDEQRLIFLKVGLSRQADAESRKKGEKVKTWLFPLGFVKSKPKDGLHFLQFMKWGVLQYCVIRPTTTLAAVVLNYIGLYCEDSWSPRWGHVYITAIVSVSVSVAMYCLIQLYIPIAPYLAPQKPLLKLFAVKAVVFLTFWQATFLSVLSMFGVVKDTQYMTADDINIGWGAILETFEMVLFAFLHIKAFSYKPYVPTSDSAQRTPRFRALAHAFDFRETFRELWVGTVYLADRTLKREPRLDRGARRVAIMEDALGRARPRLDQQNEHFAMEISIRESVDIDIEGERQWLGVGDNDAYSLGYKNRREKVDGLEEQIERELERRGYNMRPINDYDKCHDRRPSHLNYDHTQHVLQTSWWRNIYSRISQSAADPNIDHEKVSSLQPRTSRSRTHSPNIDSRSLLQDYDDVPPASAIKKYINRDYRRQHFPASTNIANPDEAVERTGNVDDRPLQLLDSALNVNKVHPSVSNRPATPPAAQRSDTVLGRIFLHANSLPLPSKTASSHNTRIQVYPQHAVIVRTDSTPGLTLGETVVPRPDTGHIPSPILEHDLIDELSINHHLPGTPSPEPSPRRPHKRDAARYRRSTLVPSSSTEYIKDANLTAHSSQSLSPPPPLAYPLSQSRLNSLDDYSPVSVVPSSLQPALNSSQQYPGHQSAYSNTWEPPAESALRRSHAWPSTSAGTTPGRNKHYSSAPMESISQGSPVNTRTARPRY